MGNFLALNAYVRNKQKKSSINDYNFKIKKLFLKS